MAVKLYEPAGTCACDQRQTMPDLPDIQPIVNDPFSTQLVLGAVGRAGDQTWKLSPQPQRPFSFGFRKTKPA